MHRPACSLMENKTWTVLQWALNNKFLTNAQLATEKIITVPWLPLSGLARIRWELITKVLNYIYDLTYRNILKATKLLLILISRYLSSNDVFPVLWVNLWLFLVKMILPCVFLTLYSPFTNVEKSDSFGISIFLHFQVHRLYSMSIFQFLYSPLFLVVCYHLFGSFLS